MVGRPTRARVDLAALRANYAVAKRLAGARDVIAVVKADAYGHGAVPVARALADAGCPRLAVLTVAEAEELRQAGLALPILVMAGVHDPEEAERAAARHLTPVVHHRGQVELLAACARSRGGSVGVQVEVDTGMSRMGVPCGEAPSLFAALAAAPGLALAGTFTHLASADETDLTPAREQLRRFGELLRLLRARGVDPGLVHLANSAGLLCGKQLDDVAPACDAVRPGIMLYGASPARHLGHELQPVMTLHTRVATVRRVEPGAGVGYGSDWRAPRASTIATLPLGYGDGVLRSLGNRGHVLLGELRLPIVGRVSMDYVTVDAGDHAVRVGDEAVLFGRGAGGVLPVEEAAERAGTIPYELLARVGSRVPRDYVSV